MKHNIFYLLKMASVCSKSRKYKTQLFFGLFISMYLFTCVLSYSFYLNHEITKLSQKNSKNSFAFIISQALKNKNREFEEYCSQCKYIDFISKSFNGTAYEFCFLQDENTKKENSYNYLGSYITIDGIKYNYVSNSVLTEHYCSSYCINVKAFANDFQINEKAEMDLLYGSYPSKLNEIAVPKELLELYAVPKKVISNLAGKKICINDTLFKDSVVSGITTYDGEPGTLDIITRTENKNLLNRSSYNLYFNTLDFKNINLTISEISEKFKIEIEKSPMMEDMEFLYKQKIFVQQVLGITVLLITISTLLNIYANINFEVIERKRITALMISLGLTSCNMFFIQFINIVKTLLFTSAISGCCSFFTINLLNQFVNSSIASENNISMSQFISVSLFVFLIFIISLFIILFHIYKKYIFKKSIASIFKFK